MDIRIRKLIEDEQQRQCGKFIESIKIEDYVSKIEKQSEIIAHYIEDECAGFISFYCNNYKTKVAFITLVLVNTNFRGKKISHSLINSAISVMSERGFSRCELEVKKDNVAAIALYKSRGFSVSKDQQHSYLMAITLRLKLTS